jgi:hypothetical protein
MTKKSRTVVPDFSRAKPTKGKPVVPQSANADTSAKKPAKVQRAVPSAPSGKGGHRGS